MEKKSGIPNPNHNGDRQLVRTKLTRQMERDLLRDGCVGVNLERKDEYLEQELQRKSQQRIRIIQDGRTRRDRRKAG